MFKTARPREHELLSCRDRKGDIYLRKYPSLESVQTFRGSNADLASLRLHPSGRWLITSTDDRLITLWDVASGRPLLILPTESGQFAQFSPDGRRLIRSTGSTFISTPLDLSLRQRDPRQLLAEAQHAAGQCLVGVQLRPLGRARACGVPEAKATPKSVKPSK